MKHKTMTEAELEKEGDLACARSPYKNPFSLKFKVSGKKSEIKIVSCSPSEDGRQRSLFVEKLSAEDTFAVSGDGTLIRSGRSEGDATRRRC